ncbi:MAG: flavodoxin family protein [Pseudomonadota bacterium]
MTKVAIVYHSGYGHTKIIAEAVRDGALKVEGVEVDLVAVEEATGDLDRFDEADAIIFGSPTYMGSASGPMATFMDATSKPWFQQKWKDKIAGGFTNSGSMSGDKLNTLHQFSTLAAQHGMIWVSLGMQNETAGEGMANGAPEGKNRLGAYIGPMAQSDNAEAGPDNPPSGDQETARLYGERVAKAAKRWGKGTL